MAETAFRSVQIGKESAYGTEVDATIVLPIDHASGELHLVRGTNIPDEDYGVAARNFGGLTRASHGINRVEGSASMVATFQHLPRFLSMAIGEITTTGSGAPYTHAIERDTTTDTTESYTWEIADGTGWTGTGLQFPSWELGFEALAAGENSAWMFSGDLQGVSLTKKAVTSSLTPAAAETIEGHMTTIAAGTTATAFASLSALTAKLVSINFAGSDPKPIRPYGGSATAAAHGRQKGLCTVTGTLLFDSTTLAQTADLYMVAGNVASEGRWRFSVTGSGSNAMTIDTRLIMTDFVPENGRDDERLVSFTAETMYDSTLGTDLLVSIVNATASY